MPLLALTATPANAQDTWETLPSLPTPREGLAAATAPCPTDDNDLTGTLGSLKKNCVYAFGGNDGTGPVGTVEVYNPATDDTWETLPSLPTPREGLAGVSAPCPDINGLKANRTKNRTCVYAIGGENSTGVLGTVEVYDPADNTWETLPSLPTPRTGLAAAAAPCPKDVEGLNQFCLYAIGGEGAGGNTLRTVQAYSPETNTWVTLPSLPTAREGLAAATAPCPEDLTAEDYSVLKDCVYAIGGENQAGAPLGTVEVYNPAVDETWEMVPSLPTPREELAAVGAPCPNGFFNDVTTDGKGAKRKTCVYAIGGGGGTNDAEALGRVEVYNPATDDTWERLPSLPTPREELAAASAPCPNGIFNDDTTTDGKDTKESKDRKRKTCVYAIGGMDGASTLGTVEAFPVHTR